MSECRGNCDYCSKPIIGLIYYNKHCEEECFCSVKCMEEEAKDNIVVRTR